MIDLREVEQEALQQVSRAGAGGVELGDGYLTASVAIRLSLDGLVNITTTRPQRAVITAKGRAFNQRRVFA